MFVFGELWRHTPSMEDTYLIGQDIALGELLWIPLQNAWFFVLASAVLILGPLALERRTTERSSLRGPFLEELQEELLFSLDSLFDMGRLVDLPPGGHRGQSARFGRLVFQVATGMSILFALPVMSVIAYGTLQILLASGRAFLIADWINWSVFGASVSFGILYLFINGMVALRE